MRIEWHTDRTHRTRWVTLDVWTRRHWWTIALRRKRLEVTP